MRKRNVRAVGFLGGLIVLFGVMSSGCFVSPDVRFVEAARDTYKAIAPSYERYVEADTTLDSDQKEDRKALLESWDARITEAEQATSGE
jgi:adenylylsulfate kinase-like enzyme